MIFGLHCYGPARRPHPASLPVRVPTVEGLLSASFGFTSRLRLAFRYGYHHRFRRAPFIPIDSAHAGHTHAGGLAGRIRRHDCRRGPQDCALHGFWLRLGCCVLQQLHFLSAWKDLPLANARGSGIFSPSPSPPVTQAALSWLRLGCPVGQALALCGLPWTSSTGCSTIANDFRTGSGGV